MSPTGTDAVAPAVPVARELLTLTAGSGLDLAQPALTVAPQLLGATVSYGGVSLVLTEVEAYEGTDDPASHAWRGPTPRSLIMFGPPGHVYVYLSHGLHHAMNLVCGPPGRAAAVLFRAGRVSAGLDVARRRRPAVADAGLARGPGNLTRALGIDLALNGSAVQLVTGRASADTEKRLRIGPRVGVSRAADRPWRFWWDDEPSVSSYRRSVRVDPTVS